VKKYLALFLIVIMAVSVLSAAGVVTAQNAAAQPMPVQTVAVPSHSIGPLYGPGAIYVYTASQFNNWGWENYSAVGTPTLTAAVSGGHASSSIMTTNAQAGETNAFDGMSLLLSLPPSGQYSTWSAVENKPCTVTVTVYYAIKAQGNQSTYAGAYWGPWLGSSNPWWWVQGSPYRQVSVVSSPTGNVKAGIAITTWHGTVEALFHNERSGWVGAAVDTRQPSVGAGQASGNIVCSSIVLAFPLAFPAT